MDQKNQYMEIAYQLYVGDEGELELMEETTQDRPFQFITGFGVSLDAFEQQVANLEKGATFEFSIPKEQAYGEYNEEHVLDLDREMFCVDGKFDSEHVYEDAVIPMQNDQGQRFYGRVAEIGDKKVKVDLNHPLAGETLHFKGSVVESRPATTKEIEALVAHLSGGCGGCGGGCHKDGGCGGGDCDCENEGGCGGGGCHCG